MSIDKNGKPLTPYDLSREEARIWLDGEAFRELRLSAYTLAKYESLFTTHGGKHVSEEINFLWRGYPVVRVKGHPVGEVHFLAYKEHGDGFRETIVGKITGINEE